MTGAAWVAADDQLSRCASVLLEMAEARSTAIEGMEFLGAPAEMAPLIARNYAIAAVGVLFDHGFTPRTFRDALVARTSERFVGLELGSLLLSVLWPDGDDS